MRYLNVILTIVVLLLGVISLRLYHIEVLVENSMRQCNSLLLSNQAVIDSDNRVITELGALKGKVQEVSDRSQEKQ